MPMTKPFVLPWLPCWVMGVLLSLLLPQHPGAGIGSGVMGLLVAVCVLRRRPWLGGLLALALGMAYGVWRVDAALSRQWPLQQTAAVPVVLTVTGLPEADARRVRLRALAATADGRQYRIVLTDYRLRDWPLGSRWQMHLRLRPMLGEVNAVGFDREAWALAQGVDASAHAGRERVALAAAGPSLWLDWQAYRGRLSARWQQTAADYPLGSALMRALSLGEQSALPPAVWQAMRPLGLNHLLSISGLHIGLVAMWAAWWCRWLLRCLPWTPRQPRLWYWSAALMAAAVYAVLAGLAVPTQRAWLMLAVLAWAWWRRRVCSASQVWWQALALVLLISPLAALSPGFWLSFGLVAALLWGGSGRIWPSRHRRWHQAWRLQAAATLASWVLVWRFFGHIAWFSPLVNAVAIPWFSWLLVPLALLGLLLPWPPLLMWMAALAEYTVRVLLWLAEWAPVLWPARPPEWLWWLSLPALGLWLLPRGSGLRPWAALVCGLLLLYRPPLVPPGQAQVTVWDVGQGLAVSVQTRQHHLLFDTGTAAAADMQLLPNLHAAGVRRLDALVLSHADADHDGGAAAVQAALAPRQVYAGQPQAYADAVRWCRDGLHWQWDGVWFEFLTLPPTVAGGDNEHSCVLRVVAGGQALLLTGDLGVKGEAALVARYGDDVYSQVLVLGHHGSRTATSPRWLRAVRPQLAVASSGFANAHNHPHPQVQAVLRQRGIMLYRTDWQGGMRLRLGDGTQPQWQPLRPRPRFWQRKPLRSAAVPD